MLILTRRIGETLLINDETTVTVFGTMGHQVRIGMAYALSLFAAIAVQKNPRDALMASGGRTERGIDHRPSLEADAD